MKPTVQKGESAPRRRRYVVHLLCVRENDYDSCRYVTRIWARPGRAVKEADAHERIFADECSLTATINPLLPSGSDVRDILSHVESPDGFFYMLWLSGEEASRLGWRG